MLGGRVQRLDAGQADTGCASAPAHHEGWARFEVAKVRPVAFRLVEHIGLIAQAARTSFDQVVVGEGDAGLD